MSTDAEKLEKFGNFLTRKRMEEAFKDGRPVSQADMARRIGIPQGSLSQYENKTRLPNETNYHKIAVYLGIEVYDILEVPRALPDDPLLISLVRVWPDLTKDMRKKLVRQAQDEFDLYQERKSGIAGDIKQVQT